MDDDLKLFPWTRPVTGDIMRSYAYVKSRTLGIVAACQCVHRTRMLKGYDTDGYRRRKTGDAYAMECAKRMLEDIERGKLPESEWTAKGRAAFEGATKL